MSKKTSADRDRIREIREKADAQRRLEEVKRRRRRLLTQLGVAGVVVVLIAGTWGGTSLLRDRAAAGSRPPSADAVVDLASGGRAQITAEEDAVAVGAADAPVTLDVYEDYEAAAGPLLDRLASSGQVRVVHHPMQIVTNYGRAAGSTAACVLQHDAAAWPDVHSALFANHSAATDSWTGADFSSWLPSQGVTDRDALTCTEKGSFAGWISSNTESAAAAGVTSTPTLLIDGQRTPTVGGQELVDALTAAGATLPAGIAAG
jgi:protein-disulfide isomerase